MRHLPRNKRLHRFLDEALRGPSSPLGRRVERFSLAFIGICFLVFLLGMIARGCHPLGYWG